MKFIYDVTAIVLFFVLVNGALMLPRPERSTGLMVVYLISFFIAALLLAAVVCGFVFNAYDGEAQQPTLGSQRVESPGGTRGK